MKPRIALLAFIILLPILAFGRLSILSEPNKLIADAKLVFVGRVTSVNPSSIRTTLSYIPYEGVTFRWQIVEVEVVESFKGIQKGDVVHAAMLSIDKQSQSQPKYSPPGMLNPRKGDIFFLCLGATPQTNIFAALSAPYEEDMSVFRLYSKESNKDESGFSIKQFLSHAKQDETNRDSKQKIESIDMQFALIFDLVGASGAIQSTCVKKFRKTFATEMEKPSSTNLVYLELETYTNSHGWQSDVPKGYRAATDRKIK